MPGKTAQARQQTPRRTAPYELVSVPAVMVPVIVIVIIIMVMVLMIIPVMITVMMVVMAVGTVLRLEGRHLLSHRSAEAAHHVIKHVIVLVAEVVPGNLKRDMAVPEMVCKPGKIKRRPGPHRRDILRRRLDKEEIALLIGKDRPAADNEPALEEDDAPRAVLRPGYEPAAPALVYGKGDRVAPAENMPRGGIFPFPQDP